MTNATLREALARTLLAVDGQQHHMLRGPERGQDGGALAVARCIHAARARRIDVGDLAHLGLTVRLHALQVLGARSRPELFLQLSHRHYGELHTPSLRPRYHGSHS